MKQRTKFFLSAMFLSFLLTTSCSSNKTHESTEVTYTDSATGEPREVRRVEHSTTEEHEDDRSCGGIASCTVDFLGDVIAFPFRLVAGIAEAIF